MINLNTISLARQLKKEAEAAYTVFKKNPSVTNAASWSAAARAYNDFCIKTIDSLIEEDSAVNKQEEIINNVDKYKRCTQCDAELLYLTSADNYVASSDFVEDFPGWCYPCLVEYCTTHNCEECTATSRPLTCSFVEVKKLLMKD